MVWFANSAAAMVEMEMCPPLPPSTYILVHSDGAHAPGARQGEGGGV